MKKRSNAEKTFKVTQEDYERDLAKYGDPDVVRKPGTYVVRPSSHLIKRGDPVTANGKTRITIFLDNEVLDYFKGKSDHYQTEINAVLRKFVDSKQTEIALISDNVINEIAEQVARKLKKR
jgi:uncharacterized protein (DUF4415 family)